MQLLAAVSNEVKETTQACHRKELLLPSTWLQWFNMFNTHLTKKFCFLSSSLTWLSYDNLNAKKYFLKNRNSREKKEDKVC